MWILIRRSHWAVPIALSSLLGLGSAAFSAEERGQPAERSIQNIEAQRGPRGYERLDRPSEVATRPPALDRQAFNHNFSASRKFHIGPYHPPGDWKYRRWQFGELLPVIFWSAAYQLTDFWLFGLDVPPVGYEWVRYGNDALLVSLTDGEISEVVYAIFS